MDTSEDSQKQPRRRRRHSAEFKAQVVAACRTPGMSMAAVALEHGLNANLLRRWVVEDERARAVGLITSGHALAMPSMAAHAGFVPIEVGRPAVAASQTIVIEVRRGSTLVKVSWPADAAAACGSWLRELLR